MDENGQSGWRHRYLHTHISSQGKGVRRRCCDRCNPGKDGCMSFQHRKRGHSTRRYPFTPAVCSSFPSFSQGEPPSLHAIRISFCDIWLAKILAVTREHAEDSVTLSPCQLCTEGRKRAVCVRACVRVCVCVCVCVSVSVCVCVCVRTRKHNACRPPVTTRLGKQERQ